MIDRLVLFGATGDLTGRLLLPGLARLLETGRLPDGFTILGAAQEGLDDEAFRRSAAEALDRHADDVPSGVRDALAQSLRYRQVDIEDADSMRGALGAAREPVAVYLALPPGLFAPTVRTLAGIGLPEGSRVALEKPFGEDLDGAVELNRLLERVPGLAGERAVFRVDHFLGMTTVQNLLGIRLANRILEPVWNSTHIERVEIVWEETLALEGRAGYYDRAGQLKDMIQNHLLQIVCLIAMEPPAGLGERDLRDRKLDVLRSVRPLTARDAEVLTRRARYTAGRIADRAVPAYADEDGVDAERRTETFAEVTFHLDGWRWDGTPFHIRTAKAMARDRMEVVICFREVPRLPFGDRAAPAPNELRIGLQIEQERDVELHVTGIAPEADSGLVPLTLTAELPRSELREYSRVLLDLLDGDSALSIRGDEAEAAWRIVTPILEAWEQDRVPLEEYPAGSEGPPAR